MTCTLCADTGTVLAEAPPDGKSRGGLVFLEERACPCTLREAEDVADWMENHGVEIKVRVVDRWQGKAIHRNI